MVIYLLQYSHIFALMYDYLVGGVFGDSVALLSRQHPLECGFIFVDLYLHTYIRGFIFVDSYIDAHLFL
jgi:hypothetical protein